MTGDDVSFATADDAWAVDPTDCPICGRDSCEGHESHGNDATHARDCQPEQAFATPVDWLPAFETLSQRFSHPRPTIRWRFENLLPVGGRMVIAAQFKVGKTTLTGNIVRSLVEDEPLLGRFAVNQPNGLVVVLDTEMSDVMLDDWYSQMGIRNRDGVVVVSMKSFLSKFDILDPKVRRVWAAKLKEIGCVFLILDCLRPVLDVLGLDEHKDVGRFLVAFDQLLAEGAVGEAVVVQHTGHNPDRSRGDSRLRDWPDVEVVLMRESLTNLASPRQLHAYGRDVDVPKQRLDYDAGTRTLTLRGDGSPVSDTDGDSNAEYVVAAIVKVLQDEPNLSGRQIKERLKPQFKKEAVDAALQDGRSRGKLTFTDGPRGAQCWQVVDASAPVSERSGVSQ